MIVVTGAGGFIGHHLVKRLVAEGHEVVGVDIKRPEFEPTAASYFYLADLRDPAEAERMIAPFGEPVETLYHLAADMGGMGYIGSTADDTVMVNSLAIDTAMARAILDAPPRTMFYSSSACVYPEDRQATDTSAPLREPDAYPADPDTLYGWEKLTAERLFQAAGRTCGTEVRIARFHNVMGPLGTWTGGKEKAPAAVCRKIATAKLTGQHEIEIWGDGEQRRSFLYIEDCLNGILALTGSDLTEPCNIGSTESVTINGLARLVASIAGCPIEIRHIPGPQGVRSRNADIGMARDRIKWNPCYTLESGLELTYGWIEAKVRAELAG